MDKTYKLAIVGATGLVGRTALKVLEEKGLVKKEFGNVNNRLVYFLRITRQR